MIDLDYFYSLYTKSYNCLKNNIKKLQNKTINIENDFNKTQKIKPLLFFLINNVFHVETEKNSFKINKFKECDIVDKKEFCSFIKKKIKKKKSNKTYNEKIFSKEIIYSFEFIMRNYDFSYCDDEYDYDYSDKICNMMNAVFPIIETKTMIEIKESHIVKTNQRKMIEKSKSLKIDWVYKDGEMFLNKQHYKYYKWINNFYDLTLEEIFDKFIIYRRFRNNKRKKDYRKKKRIKRIEMGKNNGERLDCNTNISKEEFYYKSDYDELSISYLRDELIAYTNLDEDQYHIFNLVDNDFIKI